MRFYDSNNVELVIRNTGSSDVNIDNIYIDGIGQSIEQNVKGGESTTIVIDHSWDIGTKYKIKVESTTGLFTEGIYTTPYQSQVWYD